MIQRYDIYNHPQARLLYEVKKDENGEWVKWDDVEKLIEINESMKSHILSMQEHVSNIADMTNRGLIHYGI